MFRRPKKPAGTMWLGIAFLVLGLIALPLGLGNPSGTTNAGIPVLFAAVVLLLAGLYFGALGGVWMSRDKRSS